MSEDVGSAVHRERLGVRCIENVPSAEVGGGGGEGGGTMAEMSSFPRISSEIATGRLKQYRQCSQDDRAEPKAGLHSRQELSLVYDLSSEHAVHIDAYRISSQHQIKIIRRKGATSGRTQ